MHKKIFFTVIVLIAIFGFSIVKDYGVSTDEPDEIKMVYWNLQLITYGHPLPGDFCFYGPVFNVFSEILYKIYKAFRKERDDSIISQIKFKHYITFIVSVMTCLIVGFLLISIFNWEYIWIGPIVLYLIPRFWGHSFFNPKDVPFALFFTFCSYKGAKLLSKYISGDEIDEDLFKESIIFGACAGLLTGIRAGGFIVIFFLLIGHLIIQIVDKKDIDFIYQFKKHYLLIVVFWEVVTSICYPSCWFGPFVIYILASSYFSHDSFLGKFFAKYPLNTVPTWYSIIFICSMIIWLHLVLLKINLTNKNILNFEFPFFNKLYKFLIIPFSIFLFHISFFIWFLSAITYLGHHGWKGEVLFDGKFFSAHKIPWFYIPKWLVITIPFPIQVAFLIGIILAFIKFHKYPIQAKTTIIMVFLQVFFLPFIAIIIGSTLYDGIRQFIFILPGIAFFASMAIIWFLLQIKIVILRFLFGVFLVILMIPTIKEMKILHPYEYLYFNRLSGGLEKNFNLYQTDYWGLSLTEATEWAISNLPKNSIVLVASPNEYAKFRKNVSITFKYVKYYKRGTPPFIDIPKDISNSFYYMAIHKWKLQNAFLRCPVIYKVSRKGVPLTIIKKCAKETD